MGTQMRNQFFRSEARRQQWTADYHMRAGRKKNELRRKRQFEEEWQQFMRTTGKKMGLTEPVIYKGPIYVPKDEEEADMDIESLKKVSDDTIRERQKAGIGKGWDKIPYDMYPGKFDNGPDSIFKMWRRPLHKHPYDIGRH